MSNTNRLDMLVKEAGGEQALNRIKRVKGAGYSQNNQGKCLICGNAFQECPHTTGEVRHLIDAVRQMDFLAG